MRAIGEYRGANRSLDGDLIISFAVRDDDSMLEWLSKAEGKQLVIEAKRYNEKRSLNANNYFWKLCDEIAKKLETTQDEIHDLMLYRYGVRADLTFEAGVLPMLRESFDIVLVRNEQDGFIEARCFLGSRHYDKEEMARLITGTVHDAKEQGVDTWNPDEIERLVAQWERR